MFKIILVSLFLVGSTLTSPIYDEEAAKKFIAETSPVYAELTDKLFEVYFDIIDEQNHQIEKKFVTSTTTPSTTTPSKTTSASDEDSEYDSSDYSYDYSEELTGFVQVPKAIDNFSRIKQIMTNITNLSQETLKYSVNQYKDDEVIIGILILRMTPNLFALGDEYLTKWIPDSFEEYLQNNNYCKYKSNEQSCEMKYSDIRKILVNSKDPEEILYYWKEWRERNGEEGKRKLRDLLDMFVKLAGVFDVSPKFFWYSNFLDENFGDDMESVMNDLNPLLKELHAYVRYILNKEYGENVVPENGLIPHHLFEQISIKTWKPDSVVSKEFKGVKMPIDNNFNETAREIIDLASQFMKSLGLSELPKDFWTERIKEDLNPEDNCESESFDVGPKSYLKYCKQVSIKRFFQMYGYMTKIYYSNEHKDLLFPYSSGIYDIESATSEAVILSATTPKYLHAIGHKDVDVLSEDEDMNRLYRMGLHTLFSVPQHFIHSKVVADAMENKIDIDQMNNHYWDLMKKYLGVAPPIEEPSNLLGFPYKFYSQIEDGHQTSKFAMEIMGYQIYEALCEQSGDFVKGDSSHELHNCNFYQSKKAGEMLHNMMKIGAKRPWKQVLSVITGDENGMKADGMLEYYAPLKNWLESKNKEHGVTVGW